MPFRPLKTVRDDALGVRILTHDEAWKLTCKFICDECQKEEPADYSGFAWFKPSGWYTKGNAAELKIFCSGECMNQAANKARSPDNLEIEFPAEGA